MDERARIARLHRRFGFGLAAGELDAAIGRGLDAEIGRLLDPDTAGIAPAVDPFEGQDLGYNEDNNGVPQRLLVHLWLEHMVTSGRGLEERMAWFWHGVLVSGSRKVKDAANMANQVRLFRTLGLVNLASLYNAITIDSAMLWYLDGRDSQGSRPNENYGRELLELFALGIGNYTEDDVKAAANALTGWTTKRSGASTFQAKRHNDAPQTLLGVAGVHDVATVVAAVTKQPACASFIAGKLARATLGPAVDKAVIDKLATGFATDGLDVRKLVTALVDLHRTDTDGGPIVLGPSPWLVMAERATGARLKDTERINGLRAAGQVPYSPPNVAGWPSGSAWYSSATLVGRLNLATVVAAATPPGSPALAAAKSGDWAGLSRVLGLPVDFSVATVAGLSVPSDAFARLALALVSPEFVEA